MIGKTLENIVDEAIPIPEMIPSHIKLVVYSVYLGVPEYKEKLVDLERSISKLQDSKLKGYWKEYLRLAYAGAAEIWETYISQKKELMQLKEEHMKKVRALEQEYRSRLKLWNSMTSWSDQGVLYRILIAAATYLATQPIFGDLAVTISIAASATFEGIVRLVRKRWRRKIEDWVNKEMDKVISEYTAKYNIIGDSYKKRRREKYMRYSKLALELYKKVIDDKYRFNKNLIDEVASPTAPPFTYEGKVALANLNDHYLNSKNQIWISPVV